jgi:MSHA biogenesis protein MshJ
MSKIWQEYVDKYLTLTKREQVLIFVTGLVAIFFILFYLFIDTQRINSKRFAQDISRLQQSNQSLEVSTLEMQMALREDPNEDIRNKISQYEIELANIDKKLLLLTSDLISPVQMRYALLDLLKLEKGVSLLSFELLGAEPLLDKSKSLEQAAKTSSVQLSQTETTTLNIDSSSVNLYRHGFKIKLSGSYFDLQRYLSKLEKLSWRFFWQDFNFKSKEYPKSELEIKVYSLGTSKEFVGV